MSVLVLPDANVLLSRTVRGWLLDLSSELPGMFTVNYTEPILAEVVDVATKELDLDGGQVTRLRDLLSDSMVRIDSFGHGKDSPYDDRDDAHIHAAACDHQIDIVLTFDRGFLDLDDEVRDQLTYEAMSPDQFFIQVHDSAREAVRRIIDRPEFFRSLGVPTRLGAAGCLMFADRVEQEMDC